MPSRSSSAGNSSLTATPGSTTSSNTSSLPERALFPLNFGLSRQAGLMAWGKAREGRLDWALGGFNGHLTGLADNNPNQEAVGYLNARPFLHSERFPALRHLNVGASGSLGEVARNEDPLPMRTSVQAAENDEAANDASAVFLDFNKGAVYQGSRRFGAVHLAYYYRRPVVRVGVEFRPVPDDPARPGEQARDPRAGLPHHPRLLPDRRADRAADDRRAPAAVPPLRGAWGPGAIEPFVRYSQLNLGDTSSATGSPTAASGPRTWGWSTSASTGIPTAG